MKAKMVAIASAASLSFAVAGCSGESGAGGGVSAVAEDILTMPDVEDSGALVINGEEVADADLLEDAVAEGSLTWYTGSGQESADLTAARFEAETGISVDVTRMPSGKLAERVLSEAGANRLGAEVVTITDPVSAGELADNGVYSEYKVPAIETLQQTENTVWDEGLYYTSYFSAYAFAYNTNLVEETDAPDEWEDIVDPKWKGKTGIVNGGAGGTVIGLASFQNEHLEDGYWDRLAKTEPRIFDTTSVQLESLARGEFAIATCGFNSTYSAAQQGAPIELVVPEDGVSGTSNMQGLTVTGAESAAAKVFMNWTFSQSGQQFAWAQGFVPVRADTPETPTGDYQLPKASDENFVEFTPDEAMENSAKVVEGWNAAFGY